MRASRYLLLAGAGLLALPALAQDQATPVPAVPAPSAAPAAQPAANPARETGRPPGAAGPSAAAMAGDDTQLPSLTMSPPVELPDDARRDPRVTGWLDPMALGLGAQPWRGANGAYLGTLMRRLETPIASRWAHIALRNALLARVTAPPGANPVDWAAERAWLLLRMGEADAARILISGVDVAQFTPKMFQIAVQSALANADPSGLCPLQDGLEDIEDQVLPLIRAMCDALSGEPESAASQIDRARRRGELSAIDIVLAEKIVGATAQTRRAVTVEWEPVERLNSWRFGLATATGMTFPERLDDAAPPRIRAWQAQAPLIAPLDRLQSARIAAGLGVFSSQSLIDLHSLIYDSTGPDELPETDAWQVRTAFIGEDQSAKLTAMRRLWNREGGPLEQVASRALLGRAATKIVPSADLVSDANNLITSMLYAGYDRQAARWKAAVNDMDEADSDRAWAMLALASPDPSGLDLGTDRIAAFIDRDDSQGRKRGALLVAGLAGLGRIDAQTASALNQRFGLRLGRESGWTRAIGRAGAMRQAGTVLLLTGTGLQTADFNQVPAAHLLHAIAALRNSGQDFTARMIAAEAIARS